MLQLSEISKSYTTAGFTQTALDRVTIAFRDNEFVAVLGPSGSGKTTMLNIVGGLDHYDSGSLTIDGIDTTHYRDNDWDTYRNNRIGFVFQSYNLIPHQSVLANVELALTLAGVSREERKRRATEALATVGLQDHINKRPSQLSGGQMQRVAIARALINDPEILLADEPTGALDSTTSVQIMGLLTQIAKDRLVIMVTHNPELAEAYANRIVNLKDGQVVHDSNPYDPTAEKHGDAKEPQRTSMSFFTAIALSFNNLMTKKGRTLMTAFAGSIGIIGIAAILALASGVNAYIRSIEEDTLSMYPLSIQSQGFDMSSLLSFTVETQEEAFTESAGADDDAQSGRVEEIQAVQRMFSSIGSNDLAALKVFLDGNGGNIEDYVSSIDYSYNVTPQIFTKTDSGTVRQVNPDTTFSALGLGASSSTPSFLASTMSTNIFTRLPADTSLIEQQYQVLAGNWPTSNNEVVLVLTPSGGISDFVTYAINLRDPAELDQMVKNLVNDEPIVAPESGPTSFSYEEIMATEFKLVSAADYFVYDEEFEVWTDKASDQDYLRQLIDEGEDLRISGILKANLGSTVTALSPGLYYRSGLIEHLIDLAAQTEIVQQQLASPEVNVFSGRTFADEEENPERDDFDLSKLVEVDQDAIAAAFTFDDSKLRLDTSSLNLEMPNLNLDPSHLPELDLDQVLGGMDLGGAVENLDLEQIIGQVDLGSIEFEVDQEKATQLATDLATGYAAWCMAGNECTDPQASFELFLASDEARPTLEGIEGLVGGIQDQLGAAQEEITTQLVAAISAEVEKQIAASSATMQKQLESAMANYMSDAMTAISRQIQSQLGSALEAQIGNAMEQAMGSLADNMSSAMGIDEEAFMEAFQFNVDEGQLSQLLLAMIGTGQSTFDGNLERLGYADLEVPSAIDIFPKDFEAKGQVITILEDYNARMIEEGNEDMVITYSDLVGALMGSVTDIVNVVSYVLVAFVAISLIVSSIMIGVITYISVLERKKEIGILRSIGASKRDIRRVFNAETLIVGFVAGVIGIGATLLLTLPANAIVAARFSVYNVAQLPWEAAMILVAISMGLTFLAGLIPASSASKKDPVEALRSE